MGRRAAGELVLTEAERAELVALTLRRKTAQALALRARIVLACAKPREWFLVPLHVVDEAVLRIQDGTIIDSTYDPTTAQLVVRS